MLRVALILLITALAGCMDEASPLSAESTTTTVTVTQAHTVTVTRTETHTETTTETASSTKTTTRTQTVTRTETPTYSPPDPEDRARDCEYQEANGDAFAPIVDVASIEEGSVSRGETVTVTVDAFDCNDLKLMRAWVTPAGESEPSFNEYNYACSSGSICSPGEYTWTISIPEQAPVGTYWLKGFGLRDIIGNDNHPQTPGEDLPYITFEVTA